MSAGTVTRKIGVARAPIADEISRWATIGLTKPRWIDLLTDLLEYEYECEVAGQRRTLADGPQR